MSGLTITPAAGMWAGGDPPFYPYNIDNSCRFEPGDGAHLSYTPGSAADDQKKWTFSAWIKRCELSTDQTILSAGTSNTNRSMIYIASNDELYFYSYYSAAVKASVSTDMVFRDPTNWYHIVVALDAANNQVTFYVNGTEVDQTATTAVHNSNHHINSNLLANNIGKHWDASLYWDGYMAEVNMVDGLELTASSFGEFNKYGVWVPKKYTGAYGTNGYYLKFDNDDDTSDATFTDKEAALSLDGWSNSGMETLTLDDGFDAITIVNSSGTGWCYASDDAGSTGLDMGAIAVGEVFKITFTCTVNSGTLDDGDLEAGMSNGAGAWKTTAVGVQSGENEIYVTCTAANAASYLAFYATSTDVDVSLTGMTFHKMDVDAFGWDSSGNANHWGSVDLIASNDNRRMETTSAAFITGDQVLDSPTENYPVLNYIANLNNTLSDGGLQVATNSATVNCTYGTVKIPDSGKWYFEARFNSGSYAILGIIRSDNAQHRTSPCYGGRDNTWQSGVGYYYADGNKYVDGNGGAAYGDTYAIGDTIGIAIDMDNGNINFYKNNADQGAIDISSLVGSPVGWLPYGTAASSSNTCTWIFDFGQHGFIYTPPSGYKALNTSNIAIANAYPKSTVMYPNKGFDVDIYTGTGAEHERSELSFSPDLVWIKSRSAAQSHKLTDTVRGATFAVHSHSTAVEAEDTQGVKSFDSDGFTLGTDGSYNTAAATYVAWCWVEDPDYGFDIVTYTGTGAANAVSHNLGAVPELILVKNRDQADSWGVYHFAALSRTDPETDYGVLDLTQAWQDGATPWNDTAPTSTQFTVNTWHSVNASGEDYVAYLWRSIEGFSKVFAYEGNGNADGPYVHCGFRPVMFFWKRADGINSWGMYDAKRSTYNPVENIIYPDLSNAEVPTSGNLVDICANGFKIRSANNMHNATGNTIVGIAFAEMPGVYANAR